MNRISFPLYLASRYEVCGTFEVRYGAAVVVGTCPGFITVRRLWDYLADKYAWPSYQETVFDISADGFQEVRK